MSSPPWKLLTSLRLTLARLPLQGVLGVPFLLQVVVVLRLVGGLSMGNSQRAVANLTHQLMDEIGYDRHIGPRHHQRQASHSRHPIPQMAAQELLKRFGSWHQLDQAQQLHQSEGNTTYLIQVTPCQPNANLDGLIVTLIPETDPTVQISRSIGLTAYLSFSAGLGTIGLGLLLLRWAVLHSCNQTLKLEIARHIVTYGKSGAACPGSDNPWPWC